MSKATKNGWNIGIDSDLEVVGTCGEMADMSNPRGEIIQPVWFVTAEKNGRIFYHVPCKGTTITDPESGLSATDHPSIGENGEAAALAETQDVLDHDSDPDSDPINWNFWSTVYGSQAYLSQVAEMTDVERAETVPF